jgi:alpha-methylacyl-CoA racemase
MLAPLKGLRVLDLTRLLPGPVCTWHLASLGAEVIKIEDTGAGDYARTFFQTATQRQQNLDSVFYRSINHNKTVIRLDLKNVADKQIFLGLVPTVDVVIESFRPGVMSKLGLGVSTLMALKPALVYCAITGYGSTGPWQKLACHDINSMALTGLLDQNRAPDGRPTLPNFQMADVLGGGVSAAMGCLAALWQAARTGQGGFVDVSMTDGVMSHNLTAQVAVHDQGATLGAEQDLLNGGVPCYNVYETQDGLWLALGALELKFWQIFCDALNEPAWRDQHWSLGQEVASTQARALTQAVQATLKTQTRDYWVELLTPLDCCVTPVLSLAESMLHPLFIARQVVRPDAAGVNWLQPAVQISVAP